MRKDLKGEAKEKKSIVHILFSVKTHKYAQK